MHNRYKCEWCETAVVTILICVIVTHL